MQKVDRRTVKAIQCKAPGACVADREDLHSQLIRGQIFGAFSEHERETIWTRVLFVSSSRLIPSLFSFFRDVIYLTEPAHRMFMLVAPPQGHETLSSALQGAFVDSNAIEGKCMLQASESSWVSMPGNQGERLDLGIRQLWLSAFRNWTDIAALAKNKSGDCLAHRREYHDIAACRKFASLAYRLGFDSSQIRELMLVDDPPPYGNSNEGTRKPTVRTLKRSGTPRGHQHKEIGKELFIKKFFRDDETSGVDSFFIFRSIYFAFFDKPAAELGHGDYWNREKKNIVEELAIDRNEAHQEISQREEAQVGNRALQEAHQETLGASQKVEQARLATSQELEQARQETLVASQELEQARQETLVASHELEQARLAASQELEQARQETLVASQELEQARLAASQELEQARLAASQELEQARQETLAASQELEQARQETLAASQELKQARQETLEAQQARAKAGAVRFATYRKMRNVTATQTDTGAQTNLEAQAPENNIVAQAAQYGELEDTDKEGTSGEEGSHQEDRSKRDVELLGMECSAAPGHPNVDEENVRGKGQDIVSQTMILGYSQEPLQNELPQAAVPSTSEDPPKRLRRASNNDLDDNRERAVDGNKKRKLNPKYEGHVHHSSEEQDRPLVELDLFDTDMDSFEGIPFSQLGEVSPGEFAYKLSQTARPSVKFSEIESQEDPLVNIYFVQQNGSDRSIKSITVKYSDPSAVETLATKHVRDGNTLYDTSNHRVLQPHSCFTDVTLDRTHTILVRDSRQPPPSFDFRSAQTSATNGNSSTEQGDLVQALGQTEANNVTEVEPLFSDP
jgi:hypothetical protein